MAFRYRSNFSIFFFVFLSCFASLSNIGSFKFWPFITYSMYSKIGPYQTSSLMLFSVSKDLQTEAPFIDDKAFSPMTHFEFVKSLIKIINSNSNSEKARQALNDLFETAKNKNQDIQGLRLYRIQWLNQQIKSKELIMGTL